jgi:D-sedoheptulose 7-phosphate isomerase
MSRRVPPLPYGREHLALLQQALTTLDVEVEHIEAWAGHLAQTLVPGGRVLAAGNGGSAAQAQHLTSELVGRYRDDRPAFSALALHAETSSVTAIGNDYGLHAVFARQVEAHGRPGDILLTLSTSGRSRNVLTAVAAARRNRLTTWALTGPAPNPLAAACDDAICIPSTAVATIQEVHQVVVHLLCASFDREIEALRGPRGLEPASPAATGEGLVEGARR